MSYFSLLTSAHLVHYVAKLFWIPDPITITLDGRERGRMQMQEMYCYLQCSNTKMILLGNKESKLGHKSNKTSDKTITMLML